MGVELCESWERTDEAWIWHASRWMLEHSIEVQRP